MPSFVFSSGLLIDFLIQYLFEWDFQGSPPPTASAVLRLASLGGGEEALGLSLGFFFGGGGQ